jgi:hypothetical protein
MVDGEKIRSAREALSKFNRDILEVSVLDDEAVKKISDELTRTLGGTEVAPL